MLSSVINPQEPEEKKKKKKWKKEEVEEDYGDDINGPSCRVVSIKVSEIETKMKEMEGHNEESNYFLRFKTGNNI